MEPLGVMRPILPLCSGVFAVSVNQRLPSGPAVIPRRTLLAVGMGYSVIVPLGVMRPILPILSVNQRLPSGPAVISVGVLWAVGMGNSVIIPFRCLVGVGVGPDGCEVEAPHPTRRPTSSSSSTGSNPWRG